MDKERSSPPEDETATGKITTYASPHKSDDQDATAPSATESESREPPVPAPALEEALAAVRAEAAEYLDGWRRTQAEFANYKKRLAKERSLLIQTANADLLQRLLPVANDFERAIEGLPDDLREIHWIQGILLIKKEIDAVLEFEGVLPINTVGASFDPRFHEAVSYEDAEGFDEGKIIGEVRRGYMLGDRILMTSQVRVAKSSAEADEQTPTESGGHQGEE
jgi:molecular chaperone GrpE